MSETSQEVRRRWYKSDWVIVPCMITLLLGARSSLADHYHVPSGSMEYTIMTGDRVLVDKTAYGIRLPFTGIELVSRAQPQRGDVVVFDSPADGTRLIKRVAAVAGDTVDLRDGLLSVNARALSAAPLRDSRQGPVIEQFGRHEAYLNLDAGGGPLIEKLVIPPGYVLALGDHRGSSIDSRYFGLVDAATIYGRALGVYYRRGDGLTWKPL
jgi:signal peptidase I